MIIQKNARRRRSTAAIAAVLSTALPLLSIGPGRADPVAAAPSLQTPIAATVTIDWGRTVGSASPLLYGSNDTLASDPALGPDNAGYAAGLKAMGISFLRIHNAGLTEDWSDPASQSWRVDRIAAAYDAPYLKNAVVMQTIPVAPPWCMQKDGFVDPVKYAAFCAGLVDVVNNKLHRHVKYWEPMNEWDTGEYKDEASWIRLCALFNECALAMKRADPTISVGGPALSWPDLGKVATFVKLCGLNASFVSWHAYGTGDARVASDVIMSNTPTFGDSVTAIRSVVRKAGYGNKIQLALDEFNVNFNWEQHDARQDNDEGAVFLASVLKNAADSGLDIGANWNAKDQSYGLMDSTNRWRPSAWVYEWFNHYLVGRIVSGRSDSPMIEVLPVRRSDGLRSILLINKSAGAATVTLDAGAGMSKERGVTCRRIDSTTDGETATQVGPSFFRTPLTLAPYSLLILCTREKGR